MGKLITPQETIQVIQKHSFRFQKRFGQNFLIDSHVLDKIIAAAGISKEDCSLEIGPGIGTMTQALAEASGRVVAVEIDRNLIPILSETLSAYDNVHLVNADILSLNLQQFIAEESGGRPVKVVANLPYYITTPIIMGLFESHAPIESITIMVQKEVAERMRAEPGSKDYGALSLAVQYYAYPEIVAQVPPNCFIPRPSVGSTVIKLTRYVQPPVSPAEPDLMFRLIKAAFAQRRKTLTNALSAGLGIDKEQSSAALRSLGISEQIRGEALDLQAYAELADAFGKGLSRDN